MQGDQRNGLKYQNYPKRKYTATVIVMSQHSPKAICMAAMNRKAKQPINKRHSTVQGDQRYSFKSQNSQHFPKKEIHGCHNWNVTAQPKKERHSCLEF